MENKLSAINQENLSANLLSTSNPKKRKQPSTPTESDGEAGVTVQGPKAMKLKVARTYASP